MKIIIEYPDEMLTSEALELAAIVVKDGRISEAGGIKHFCWLTRLRVWKWEAEIITRRRRSKKAADSLMIRIKQENQK